MEHWWNYTDKEKLKYPEKELSQCHFIRHISQMDCPKLRPASSQYQQVPPHVPNPQRQFVYLIRATGDLIGPVVLLRLPKVIKTCNQHYGKRILKHSKPLQETQNASYSAQHTAVCGIGAKSFSSLQSLSWSRIHPCFTQPGRFTRASLSWDTWIPSTPISLRHTWILHCQLYLGSRDSSDGKWRATGWTVRGSNPGKGNKLSLLQNAPTGYEALPASCSMRSGDYFMG
jgi:hypothetical protein